MFQADMKAGALPKRPTTLLKQLLKQHTLTGTFLTTSLGIEHLYNCQLDLENDDLLLDLSVSIAKHYTALFDWYVGEKPKMDLVYDFMHNNAVDLYGYGEKLYPG